MTQTFDDLHPRAAAGTFADKSQSPPQVTLGQRIPVRLTLDRSVLDKAELAALEEHLRTRVLPGAGPAGSEGGTWRKYFAAEKFTEKFFVHGKRGPEWYFAAGDVLVAVPASIGKAAELMDTTVVSEPLDTEPEVEAVAPPKVELTFSEQQQRVRVLRNILSGALSSQERWNDLMGGRSGDMVVNRSRTALLNADNEMAATELRSLLRRLAELEAFYANGLNEYNEPFTDEEIEGRDSRLAALHGDVVRARATLDDSTALLEEWNKGDAERRQSGVA